MEGGGESRASFVLCGVTTGRAAAELRTRARRGAELGCRHARRSHAPRAVLGWAAGRWCGAGGRGACCISLGVVT